MINCCWFSDQHGGPGYRGLRRRGQNCTLFSNGVSAGRLATYGWSGSRITHTSGGLNPPVWSSTQYGHHTNGPIPVCPRTLSGPGQTNGSGTPCHPFGGEGRCPVEVGELLPLLLTVSGTGASVSDAQVTSEAKVLNNFGGTRPSCWVRYAYGHPTNGDIPVCPRTLSGPGHTNVSGCPCHRLPSGG